jgi:hypothetical protein
MAARGMHKRFEIGGTLANGIDILDFDESKSRDNFYVE